MQFIVCLERGELCFLFFFFSGDREGREKEVCNPLACNFQGIHLGRGEGGRGRGTGGEYQVSLAGSCWPELLLLFCFLRSSSFGKCDKLPLPHIARLFCIPSSPPEANCLAECSQCACSPRHLLNEKDDLAADI